MMLFSRYLKLDTTYLLIFILLTIFIGQSLSLCDNRADLFVIFAGIATTLIVYIINIILSAFLVIVKIQISVLTKLKIVFFVITIFFISYANGESSYDCSVVDEENSLLIKLFISSFIVNSVIILLYVKNIFVLKKRTEEGA